MSLSVDDDFERLIKSCGEGYILDFLASSGGAKAHIPPLFERINKRWKERFRARSNPITPESLIETYKLSPHKVKAFIQAMVKSQSPDMLIMVWRILEGMEVQNVELQYQLRQSFHLKVTLTNSVTETAVETYESSNVFDEALLRHFGIMTVSGEPVLDGFYPLKG